MEARLELKLSQKLIMTPQLQQAIKLLQLSRLELVQSVAQELTENPVLEELSTDANEEASGRRRRAASGNCRRGVSARRRLPSRKQRQELKNDLELGPQWDEYLNELGDGRDFGYAETDDKDLPSYDQTLTRLPSLSDHLLWQLHLSTSTRPSLRAESGSSGTWTMTAICGRRLRNWPAVRASAARYGARSRTGSEPSTRSASAPATLQECLLIQVRHLDLEGSLVEKIIRDHLADLEKRKYPQIAKTLECDHPGSDGSLTDHHP